MQYLLFGIGKERFAIDALLIKQIHKVVPVTKLPFVAQYIDGLVNIEGEVLVQLNLPALMNIPMSCQGEIMIVSVNDYEMALKVDEVREKIIANEEDVNDFQGGATDKQKKTPKKSTAKKSKSTKAKNDDDVQTEVDYIQSELTVEGKTYLIISPEKFVDLVKPKEFAAGQPGILSRNKDVKIADNDQRLGYLTFRVGKETLALPLLKIHEVVEMNRFTEIPGSPETVTGLASLRNQPVLVLSAQSIFELEADSLEPEQEDEFCQVLMLPYDGAVVGLHVDEVLGIKNFSQSQVKKEQSKYSFVDSYVIDGDGTIILLINTDTVFSDDILDSIDQFLPKVRVDDVEQEREKIRLLKIALGSEVCAIPVENVVRISEFKNSAKVEESEKGIIGTVDIDGNIIPLLDINDKLNIVDAPLFENLVVVEFEGKQWAICITEAHSLFDLVVDAIDYSGTQREAVKGIATYKGELISILNFDWLASRL